MDRIFKNDTVMGIIAVLTFALVAYSFYQNYKSEETLNKPS